MSTGTQKAAAGYMRSGAAVIPIPAGSKNPGRDDWQSLRITAEDIPNYWTNGQGIGLLTGEPSGWLVDVDLDFAEAVKIAGRFLPRRSRAAERAARTRTGGSGLEARRIEISGIQTARSASWSSGPQADKPWWHLPRTRAERTTSGTARAD